MKVKNNLASESRSCSHFFTFIFIFSFKKTRNISSDDSNVIIYLLYSCKMFKIRVCRIEMVLISHYCPHCEGWGKVKFFTSDCPLTEEGVGGAPWLQGYPSPSFTPLAKTDTPPHTPPPSQPLLPSQDRRIPPSLSLRSGQGYHLFPPLASPCCSLAFLSWARVQNGSVAWAICLLCSHKC